MSYKPSPISVASFYFDGEGEQEPESSYMGTVFNAFGVYDAETHAIPIGSGLCLGNGCFRTMPKYHY